MSTCCPFYASLLPSIGVAFGAAATVALWLRTLLLLVRLAGTFWLAVMAL